jgi:hypothetical protein
VTEIEKRIQAAVDAGVKAALTEFAKTDQPRGSLQFAKNDKGEHKDIFELYLPITKVSERSDGSLVVEAWANVSDFIDSDGEYFSLAGLQKFLDSWVKVGNFRYQHDPKKPAGTIRQPAIGKAIDMDGEPLGAWIQKHPTTGTMGILTRSHATLPEAIRDIKASVLTGLSVGGSIPPGGRKVMEVEVDDTGKVIREIGEAA